MKILNVILLLITIAETAFSQQSCILTKEQVNDLYFLLYTPSEVTSTGWRGSVSNCSSGTINADIYKKVEDRINFFRLVNGLNTVKNNPKLNQPAQDAALLIKANDILTHYPDKSMKCFSQSAYDGCSKSCLGQFDFENFPEAAFITGYIQDYGESNYYVGHRKWVLYSKLTSFGYGATDETDALLTVDGVSNNQTVTVDYIAYPWYGYVPVRLIFPKWSFSIPDSKTVDFSNATISMTDDRGKTIAIERQPEKKDLLDHTIVWIVKGLFSDHDIQYTENRLAENGYLNRRITVKISNVKVDGNTRNYEYFVEPFQPASEKEITGIATTVNYEGTADQEDEQSEEIWKDVESDNLFIELLESRGFIDPQDPSSCLCTATGYLKNIDYFYVSYEMQDEFSYSAVTELFRISSTTRLSDFMYTKDNVSLNDPNPNHCVIWDMGDVDAFENYLVIYDEVHVAIYKKSTNANEYDLITDFRCSNENEDNPNCELNYNTDTRQVERRIYSNPDDKKGIVETYKIVKGKLVKIN